MPQHIDNREAFTDTHIIQSRQIAPSRNKKIFVSAGFSPRRATLRNKTYAWIRRLLITNISLYGKRHVAEPQIRLRSCSPTGARQSASFYESLHISASSNAGPLSDSVGIVVLSVGSPRRSHTKVEHSLHNHGLRRRLHRRLRCWRRWRRLRC